MVAVSLKKKNGTDLQAVAEGYISVTPIHMDMTHRASFERLRRVLGQGEGNQAAAPRGHSR